MKIFHSFETTRFDQLDFDKFCMLTNLVRIFILPKTFLDNNGNSNLFQMVV